MLGDQLGVSGSVLFSWFLRDLNINSKQVVYICFKILLERMTNH